MKARRVVAVLALGLVVGVSISGLSQVFPLGLLPAPPASSEPFDVYVWTMDSAVSVGEPLTVHLSATAPVFLYLFDLQPDGLVRLIFPNAYSPDSFVPGTAIQLPNGPYELIATPPAGVEEFLLLGSTVPLPFPIGNPADPFPVFADSPEMAISEIVSILAAADPEPNWSIAWHAVQIIGAAPEDSETPEMVLFPAPPPRPPFTATPGDAWYRFNAGWFPGIPVQGWYWYGGLDFRWHLSWEME